jgi:hypothetical protein
MKSKSVIALALCFLAGLSLIALVFSNGKESSVSAEQPVQESSKRSPVEEGKAAQNVPAAKADHVIAYYLHTNRRCPTCYTIEAYTEEALNEKFGEALKTKKLEWHSVDVTVPDNKHFVTDYQIVAQSVVLSDMRGGEQKKWKNLDKVWKLVRDKQAFFSYIQTETADFLKE